MNLPHYAIVGIRPVKAVTTKEGGLIILAFNWETGKFDPAMEYLEVIFFGKDEVEQVPEEVFEKYVAKLRRNSSKGS